MADSTSAMPEASKDKPDGAQPAAARLAGLGVLVLVMIGCAYAYATRDTRAAKSAVTEQLKDPDSAQFSGLRESSDGKHICGYVNAKNSFGGYVGERPFFVIKSARFARLQPADPRKGTDADAIAEQVRREMFDEEHRKVCG